MNENKYLEQVRNKTRAALWVMFLMALALSVFAEGPEATAWARALYLVITVAMTTTFCLRQNWGRAILFGLITTDILRLIIG